jgi:hypothetical protein
VTSRLNGEGEKVSRSRLLYVLREQEKEHRILKKACVTEPLLIKRTLARLRQLIQLAKDAIRRFDRMQRRTWHGKVRAEVRRFLAREKPEGADLLSEGSLREIGRRGIIRLSDFVYAVEEGLVEDHRVFKGVTLTEKHIIKVIYYNDRSNASSRKQRRAHLVVYIHDVKYLKVWSQRNNKLSQKVQLYDVFSKEAIYVTTKRADNGPTPLWDRLKDYIIPKGSKFQLSVNIGGVQTSLPLVMPKDFALEVRRLREQIRSWRLRHSEMHPEWDIRPKPKPGDAISPGVSFHGRKSVRKI